MSDSVIKFILVEIDSGMFCKYSDKILLVSVSGILLNMINVFFIEVKVMIRIFNIINKVIGIMMDKCWLVDFSCLKVLL